MANTVPILNYANTFGDWVVSTNALAQENNNLASGNYTKNSGLLTLNAPGTALSVSNNSLFQGNTLVQGIGQFTNLVTISGGTPSTSNTTGTLQISGGVGVTGNINSGSIYVTGASSNGIIFVDGTTQVTQAAPYNYSNASFALANTTASQLSANVSYFQGVANKANTDISYLQGANDTQNTNIIAVNNFAGGAYTQANAATNSATAAYNAANTNATNITVIQGVDNTQNTNITATNNFAGGAFTQANAATNSAQSAYNVANTASSNTIYTQGVDATQNTNITAINNFAAGAYNTANNASSNTVYLQGVIATLNTASSNSNTSLLYIAGVDATQNTNITAVNNFAGGAYNTANNASSNTIVLQGVDNTQNTNITSAWNQANAANNLAASAYAFANTLQGGTAQDGWARDKANGAVQTAFTTFVANGTSFSSAANTGTFTFTSAVANGINILSPSANTIDFGLRTTGVTAKTYGDASNIPQITVDQFGRITLVSNTTVSIPPGTSIVANSGQITANASTGVVALGLANTGVSSGTYGNSSYYPIVTVDSYGRVSTITTTQVVASGSNLVLQNYAEVVQNLGNISGSATINLSSGNHVKTTVTGTITSLTFNSSYSSSYAVGFVLEITNGGNYPITWPTGTKWPGGVAPSLTTNGTDILLFVSSDGGTTWRGMVSMLDSR